MGHQRAKRESTVLSFIGWSLVCCDAVLLLTYAPLSECMHTGYRYQIEAKAKFHKVDKGLLKDLLLTIHVEDNIYMCALGVT